VHLVHRQRDDEETPDRVQVVLIRATDGVGCRFELVHDVAERALGDVEDEDRDAPALERGELLRRWFGFGGLPCGRRLGVQNLLYSLRRCRVRIRIR
jgi:hypothetical protein